MSGRYVALSILALGAGLAGGIFTERLYLNPADMTADTGPDILYWVAPMDANFRQDTPGKSPMGMDLVPVYAGAEPSADPSAVILSPAEINAIGVRTAIAQVADIAQSIETVGFVGYDEHLTSHVHTRVDGWIEDLTVRAVGDRVTQGDIMFEMFSPVIGSASAEHIRSLEEGNERIIEISRNKLRSHGMSDRQIEEMEASRAMARNLMVYASPAIHPACLERQCPQYRAVLPAALQLRRMARAPQQHSHRSLQCDRPTRRPAHPRSSSRQRHRPYQ
jgi:Cu(I)/Ag(I) efflux system membrane fusion protein